MLEWFIDAVRCRVEREDVMPIDRRDTPVLSKGRLGVERGPVRVVGHELLGWVPVVGLAGMILNDHFFRVWWPGWLTGKLSDFAVLMFIPFLLTATFGWLEMGLRWLGVQKGSGHGGHLTRTRLLVAHVLGAGALVVINVSPTLAGLYVSTLEAVDFLGMFGRFTYTTDPSDCLALLVCPLTWWWGNRILLAETPRLRGGAVDLRGMRC